MMVIHFNDPPSQGALHIIIFLKPGQGIINFYKFCAVKNLKAQCKEQEVPMQFILYPVTSNSHRVLLCLMHTHILCTYLHESNFKELND